LEPSSRGRLRLLPSPAISKQRTAGMALQKVLSVLLTIGAAHLSYRLGAFLRRGTLSEPFTKKLKPDGSRHPPHLRRSDRPLVSSVAPFPTGTKLSGFPSSCWSACPRSNRRPGCGQLVAVMAPPASGSGVGVRVGVGRSVRRCFVVGNRSRLWPLPVNVGVGVACQCRSWCCCRWDLAWVWASGVGVRYTSVASSTTPDLPAQGEKVRKLTANNTATTPYRDRPER